MTENRAELVLMCDSLIAAFAARGTYDGRVVTIARALRTRIQHDAAVLTEEERASCVTAKIYVEAKVGNSIIIGKLLAIIDRLTGPERTGGEDK